MSFASKPLPKLFRNPLNQQANKVLVPQPTPSPIQKNEHQNADKQMEMDRRSDLSKQKEHPKGNILHISNICPKLSYEQIKKGLYDLFSIHGPIYEIVIKTKETGQHFAFVDYPNISDAEKAWKASRDKPKKLQNKILQVNYCEDPKKNDDRKDQKCFLCHGTGHKAIRCPVKPEMIKKKPKKFEESYMEEDEITSVEPPKLISKPVEMPRSPSSSSSSQIIDRDPDYLRFLKLKRKILQQKLNKKLKKSKKKRS